MDRRMDERSKHHRDSEKDRRKRRCEDRYRHRYRHHEPSDKKIINGEEKKIAMRSRALRRALIPSSSLEI
jgi:hypothetical protein